MKKGVKKARKALAKALYFERTGNFEASNVWKRKAEKHFWGLPRKEVRETRNDPCVAEEALRMAKRKLKAELVRMKKEAASGNCRYVNKNSLKAFSLARGMNSLIDDVGCRGEKPKMNFPAFYSAAGELCVDYWERMMRFSAEMGAVLGMEKELERWKKARRAFGAGPGEPEKLKREILNEAVPKLLEKVKNCYRELEKFEADKKEWDEIVVEDDYAVNLKIDEWTVEAYKEVCFKAIRRITGLKKAADEGMEFELPEEVEKGIYAHTARWLERGIELARERGEKPDGWDEKNLEKYTRLGGL